MRHLSFRWIGGLLQKTFWPRRRRRAASPKRRSVIFLEQLETRELLSFNVWLPQRLAPLDGISEPSQSLQLFQPVGGGATAPLGFTGGSSSLSGGVILTDTGSYQLSIVESTSILAGFSTLYTVAGPVQFTLVERANIVANGYAISSVVLTQSAHLSWSYVENSSSGAVLANRSGSETLSTMSLGTTTLDPYLWQALNWAAPLQQLSATNSVSFSSNPAITVRETGVESYTFLVPGGQQLITGTGVGAVPSLVLTGVATYGYRLNSGFSYTSSGADTFSLFEQGGVGAAGYNLPCVNYGESGNPSGGTLANGQAGGAAFRFGSTGSVAETGTGQQRSSLGTSANATAQYQNFQFTNQLTYSYSENSKGTRYSLNAQGCYANDSLALSMLCYQAQGSGNYSSNLRDVQQAAGTFRTTQSALSATSGAANVQSNTTATGTFTNTTTLTRGENGGGQFQLAEAGQYAHGALDLKTVTLTESANGTVSGRQISAVASRTTSGTFTNTTAGATQNAIVHGTFTARSSAAGTVTQSASVSYSLVAAGSDLGGSVSLSCYVYRAGEAGTVAANTVMAATQSGTAASLASGSTPASGSAGGSGYRSTMTEQYSARSNATSSAGGAFSLNTYEAGAYADGHFALTSASFGQSQRTTYALASSVATSASGSFVSRQWGSATGSTAGSNTTFSQTSTGTFTSTGSTRYIGSGSSQSAGVFRGAYANGSYGQGTGSFTSSGGQQITTIAQGAAATTSSGSAQTRTTSSQGTIGAYGPAGGGTLLAPGSFSTTALSTFQQTSNGSWSSSDTSSSASTLTEVGRYAAGSWNMSSVVFSLQSHDAWSLAQGSTIKYHGSVATTATGAGSVGTLGNSSNGTFGSGGYRLSATGSYQGCATGSSTAAGMDSASLSERGSTVAGTFAFSSVVYREQQSAHSSTSSVQRGTVTGTVQWSGSNLTRAARSEAGQALTTTSREQASSQSSYRGRYSNTCATQSSQSGTSTSMLVERGVYAGGSYAFSSWTYTAKGTQSGTSSSSANSVSLGSGTDAFNSSSNQTVNAPSGLFNVTSRRTASSSADSYAQNESWTLQQSQAYLSTSLLYEAGTYAANQWSMSSVNYSTQSTTNASTRQRDAGSQHGTYTVSSAVTVTRNGPNASGSLVTTQASNGTYANRWTDTLNQTGTGSASLRERGTYSPTGHFSLPSVVAGAAETVNASLTSASYSQLTTVTTDSLLSTTIGTTPGGWTAARGGGWNYSAGGYANSRSVVTVATQYSTTTASAAQSLAWSQQQADAGRYAGGSYAFSKANATTVATDRSSGHSATLTTTIGTTAETDRSTIAGSTGYRLSSSGSSAGPVTVTQSGTSSSSLSSVLAANFSESAAASYQQTALVTASLTQRGQYANGSYAFSSMVYRYNQAANATDVQTNTTHYNGTQSTNARGGAGSSQTTNAVLISQLDGSLSTSRLVLQSGSSLASTAQVHELGTVVEALSATSNSSYSLYQAGRSANGSTSLSSVVLRQGGTQTTTATTVNQDHQVGALYSYSESTTGSASALTVPNGRNNSATGTVSARYTNLTYNQTTTSTVRELTANSSSLYESGSCDTRGNSTFGAVVTRAASTSAATTQLTSVQSSTEQSGSALVAGTNATSRTYFLVKIDNQAYDIEWLTLAQGTTSSGDQVATDTLVKNVTNQSAQATTRSSTNFYSAGSYSATRGWSLSSVNYRANAANGANVQSSSTVTTTTGTTSSNTTYQYDNSSRSVIVVNPAGTGTTASSYVSATQARSTSTQVECQTSMVTSSSSASFSERGRYAAGSFAFGSMVYQDSSNVAASTKTNVTDKSVTSRTQAASAASSNSGVDLAHAQLNGTFAFLDISSAGTTTLTNQSGSQSNRSGSQVQGSLYEAGSATGSAFALSSVGYHLASSDSSDVTQTAQTSQVITTGSIQDNHRYAVGTMGWVASSGTMSVSRVTRAETSLTSSLSSQVNATIAETGALTAAGYSLNCVVDGTSGGSSFTENSLQTQQSTQRTNQAGNLAFLFSLASQPDSTSSVNARSLTTSESARTGQYAFSYREAGRYGGGSFSLSSTVFTDQSSSGETFTSDSTGTVTSLVSKRFYGGTSLGGAGGGMGSMPGGGMGGGGSMPGGGMGSMPTGAMGGSSATGNSLDRSRETFTNSLYSYEHTSESLYAAGSCGTAASLTSYHLSAASSQFSQATVTQDSRSTVTNYSGPNVVGGGTAVISLAQASWQLQSANIDARGSTTAGNLRYSQVSFGANGQSDAAYTYTRNERFWGNANGCDQLAINANGTGSFAAKGLGSTALDVSGRPVFGFRDFSLVGTSNSKFHLTDVGYMGTVTYNHLDDESEGESLTETGRMLAVATGAAWSFSYYNQTIVQDGHITDQVGLNSDQDDFTTTSVLSGTGPPANGVLTVHSAGTFVYNYRTTGYDNTTTNGSILPTMPIAGLMPQGAPFSFGPPATRAASAVPTLLPQIAAMPVAMSALHAPMTALATAPPLPVLNPPSVPAYGGWLSGSLPAVSGPLIGFAPVGALDLHSAAWQQSYTALNDALGLAQMNQHFNPLQMRGQGAFQGQTAGGSTTLAYDIWAYIGMAADYVTGLIDGITFGLASRALHALGLDWLVDQQSKAYQQGVKEGRITAAVLSAFGGNTLIGVALRLLQVAGALLNAAEAMDRGDYAGAATWLMMTVGIVAGGATGCGKSPAGLLASQALALSGAALDINIGLFQNEHGDLDGALSSLASGTTGMIAALRSCFTAEMLLDTADGKKRADTIAEGDRLWSRSEFDPSGPCELKEVEEVFVREALIWNVHVAGQILRTTAEHPFWTAQRGWVPACGLRIGDLVSTRDGQLVPVEGVAPTGAVETVYNWRVQDYHTYFVGGEDWGFSVWAHNATYGASNGNSASSTKANHGYAIFDKTTGEVYKFGVSSSTITAAGNSPRAVNQVNALNAAGGNYTSTVLTNFTNRADALRWEAQTVGTFRDLGHALPGNIRPPGIPFAGP